MLATLAPPRSSTCPPVTAFWAGSSSLLRDPWILKIAALFRALLAAERNLSILVLKASGMTRLLIPTNNIFLQPMTTLYHIDNGRNILTRPDLWLAEEYIYDALLSSFFILFHILGSCLKGYSRMELLWRKGKKEHIPSAHGHPL